MTRIDNATDLAHTLRARRAELSLTQEELAAVTGLNRRVIGELERGRISPRFDTVHRIANALGSAHGAADPQGQRQPAVSLRRRVRRSAAPRLAMRIDRAADIRDVDVEAWAGLAAAVGVRRQFALGTLAEVAGRVDDAMSDVLARPEHNSRVVAEIATSAFERLRAALSLR